MAFRKWVTGKLRCTALGTRLLEDKPFREVWNAVLSLIFNLAYALYNGVLGFTTHSVLFFSSAVYYLLLSVMRFVAVTVSQRGSPRQIKNAAGAVGALLSVLSMVLSVTVFFSIRQNGAAVHGTIPMITIATYTFVKITMAVIKAMGRKPDEPKLLEAIRTIRCTEAAVSLMTMQQSMLVSFGEGDMPQAIILNAFTGTGVCVFVLIMGIITMKNSKE